MYTKSLPRAKVRAEITGPIDHEMPEGFDPHGYAWKVVLRFRGRRMGTPFFTGSMCGEPTVIDVMTSLCLDACGFDNARSFDDWAAEYGYDPDSRTAERLYVQVQEQTERLRTLLGDDFETIVYADEDDLQRWLA